MPGASGSLSSNPQKLYFLAEKPLPRGRWRVEATVVLDNHSCVGIFLQPRNPLTLPMRGSLRQRKAGRKVWQPPWLPDLMESLNLEEVSSQKLMDWPEPMCVWRTHRGLAGQWRHQHPISKCPTCIPISAPAGTLQEAAGDG